MRVSVALLALATAASAQSQNYTSSLDMTLDPNAVDPGLRSTWCRAQDDTCRTLCSNSASTNDCDPNDLSYECLCSSNDSAPGLQYYTQTMPTFICQTLLDQCIEQNVGSQRGQEECRDTIETLCGEQNPPSADEISDDDDEDDSEETSATTTTQAPAETSSGSDANEDDVTTTESDGFAAPTAAPKAVGALAAIGLVAAFI